MAMEARLTVIAADHPLENNSMEELAHMESVLWYTNWFSFLVGTAVNTLLLWLIRNRSTAELRPYTYILAQTAIFDLALGLTNLLWEPVTLSNGSISYTYGLGLAMANGTLGADNRLWNACFYFTWVFVSAMAAYATPAQFYYRFSVVEQLGVPDR
jgi:Serpentine type 7TM GPCR chemoreceptor Srd